MKNGQTKKGFLLGDRLGHNLKLIGLLALVLALSLPGTHAQASDTEALIELLREKGILTQDEANDLREEIEQDDKGAQQKAAEKPSLPEAKKEIPHKGHFFWDEGLEFQSEDGQTFKGEIGGRIMWDVAAFAQDSAVERLPTDVVDSPNTPIGNLPAETEFRRVRIFTEGELDLSLPTMYKLQLGFAGGEVSFKDVYLGWKEIPVLGQVRVGHFKEPFSLEELTSSKYIQFMERAAPIEAFSPGRNTGVGIDQTAFDERLTWHIGGFVETDGSGNGQISGNQQVTARVTGLPFYQKEESGERLLHLGLNGRVINPEDDTMRIRSRPEAHLAPHFVDTGNMPVDQAYTLAPEIAMVWSSFSVRSEYFRNWLDSRPAADPTLDGYYVAAGWFITGEQRPYDRSSGAFGRVIPHRNFSLAHGGLGAWQLGVRYSSTDLGDGLVQGGDLDSLTFGLNWHLNSQARIMFNYGFANVRRGNVDGDTHLFQTRFQVDF